MNCRRWLSLWMIAVTLSLLARPGWPASSDPPKVRYEKALQLAREGRAETAIPIFRELTEEFPEEPLYLYDYMTALGWAGHDQEVLSLRSRVDPESAPVYLLETIGRSARNLGEYPLSIRCYEKAAERAPDRVETKIGLALAHADGGAPQKAIEILRRLDEQHSKRIDVLEALAHVYQVAKNNVEALALYQRILEIDSKNREARRQQILLTAQLGAPHLAVTMAREQPDLLSRKEFEAILGDAAAQSIRWGALYNPSPRERFYDTDAAIQLLEEQAKRLREQSPFDAAAHRRARLDLMLALKERKRTREVISLYEALLAERVNISDDALLAAADAYLREKKPEAARDLYLQFLERNPNDFDARISLFYAYFDAGDYSSARRLIERLASEQKDPARKLQAESAAIKGAAWSGRLAEAQRRLAPLVEQAPNNPDLHTDPGYVYLWRGWPRRALEEFQLAQAIESELLEPQIGETEVRLALSEFSQAKENLLRLEEKDPESDPVRRLRRSWDIHNLRELRVSLSGRNNSGVVQGARDQELDAILYSRPIAYRYRLFLHSQYNRSVFPEGIGLYRRQGAGVEYRARDIKIESELSTGETQSKGLGLALRTGWTPDDHWTLGAHVDTNSNEVPLRGRLNDRVDGWAAGLNVDYRFHESRSIGIGLERLAFSDTNRRTVWSAVLFQRLIAGPVYKLDGRLVFSGSANTLENAPYYNPANDRSAEISLTNEWLIFRRDTRSLLHRLGLMLGTYSESGFATKGIWGINYEQEWSLNDRLDLLYGIGRYRPVYDGVPETSVRYYLTLNWRF